MTSLKRTQFILPFFRWLRDWIIHEFKMAKKEFNIIVEQLNVLVNKFVYLKTYYLLFWDIFYWYGLIQLITCISGSNIEHQKVYSLCQQLYEIRWNGWRFGVDIRRLKKCDNNIWGKHERMKKRLFKT